MGSAPRPLPPQTRTVFCGPGPRGRPRGARLHRARGARCHLAWPPPSSAVPGTQPASERHRLPAGCGKWHPSPREGAAPRRGNLGPSASSSVRAGLKSKVSELERHSSSWLFSGDASARDIKTCDSMCQRPHDAPPWGASSLSLPPVHRQPGPRGTQPNPPGSRRAEASRGPSCIRRA